MVPEPVPLELGKPEIESRLGKAGERTPGVPVPEAPVNEDGLPYPAKDDVGPAWQVPRVEAVPVSHRMEKTPDDHLGLGAGAPDQAHPMAAFPGSHRVRHEPRILIETTPGADCPGDHCPG